MFSQFTQCSVSELVEGFQREPSGIVITVMLSPLLRLLYLFLKNRERMAGWIVVL